MIDTIGPMVDEARRRGVLVRIAHVLGGVTGGAVIGTGVALLGLALGTEGMEGSTRNVVIGLATIALVYDLFTHGRRLGMSRQTPIGWRDRFSPPLAAFLYGADLGTGASTRIYFASYLVGLTAAAVSAAPLVGAVIGAGFGLARATTVVIVGRRAFASPTLVDDVAERRRLIEALNAAAIVQFGVVLLFV